MARSALAGIVLTQRKIILDGLSSRMLRSHQDALNEVYYADIRKAV